MADEATRSSTYCVAQTVETFHYPAGKQWGPYVHLIDAEARVETLRYFKGDGRITTGDNFGAPCQERRGK